MKAETLQLNAALSLFSPHLPELQRAVLDNLSHILESIPKPQVTENKTLDWVKSEVYKLEVADKTKAMRRNLKAINGRLQAQKHHRFAPVTGVQIATAREYPIEELAPNEVRRGMMICPFHGEKTGSLHIKKNNTWKCYGCQLYGDSIDFYQRLHDCDFITAVRALS